MQATTSIPLMERIWRRALDIADGLAESAIWQGMSRRGRQTEEVKQHADQLAMVKGLDRLFFRELFNYPDWIRDAQHRGEVCSLITEARRISSDTIYLRIEGHDYRFVFSSRLCGSPDCESHRHGTLQLAVDGQSVLRLHLVKDAECSDDDWHEVDIDRLVPGDWVQGLRHLEQQVLLEKKARAFASALESA